MSRQFGKWTVEKTLKVNRCYLATSEDGQKGVVKINQKIEHEVRLLKYLDHPNIITLLDYDLDTETPYLVTEYFDVKCDGIPTSPYISGREATSMILDICEALAYCLGKGVSIDDIEILTNEDNEVRILDFGSTSVIDRVGTMKRGLNQIQEKIDSFQYNICYDPHRKQQKAELLN